MSEAQPPFSTVRSSPRPRWTTGEPTDYEKNYLIPKLPTSSTHVRIMSTLASLAHGDNEVSASKGTIAAAANTSDKSVRRALKEFKERGWVNQTYQSRGLADPTGQRTNTYTLNWVKIRRDAEQAFAEKTAAHHKAKMRREEAYKLQHGGDPSSAGPADQLKGDKKGDSRPVPAPPKGDRMTPNLVSLPGKDSLGTRQLREGCEASSSADPTLPSSDWNVEFSAGDGVTFETLAGSVMIPGEVAERWVSWMATDGVAVLESASSFMAKHGMVAPGRSDLMVFLAEYARWVAQGRDGTKLVEIARGFKANWAERARTLCEAEATGERPRGGSEAEGASAGPMELPWEEGSAVHRERM